MSYQNFKSDFDKFQASQSVQNVYTNKRLDRIEEYMFDLVKKVSVHDRDPEVKRYREGS